MLDFLMFVVGAVIVIFITFKWARMTAPVKEEEKKKDSITITRKKIK